MAVGTVIVISFAGVVCVCAVMLFSVVFIAADLVLETVARLLLSWPWL